MKSTHFSNRDSLKDAMKNLGVKHSDIDMTNKRMPVNMSVENVIEKPMNFKKGGMAMKKPCMNMGGMISDGSEIASDKENSYKKGGMCGMKSKNSRVMVKKSPKY